MTRAHEGSTLVLRNGIKSLPEGMILFPFDGRVFDTTNRIPVLSNVTTFKDSYESKFSGSVAVEDATTNQLTSTTPQYVDWNSQGIKSTSYIDEDGYVIKKYWKDDGTDFNAIWWHALKPPIDTNSPYSYSVYARGKGTAFLIVHQSNWDNDDKERELFGPSVTLDPVQWKRLTIKKYYVSDAVSFHNVLINLSAGSGNYIEVKKPQIERLDHVTSFTDNTRPAGALRFDISSLGMKDAGCVSFWALNSEIIVNHGYVGGALNNTHLFTMGSDNSNSEIDPITVYILHQNPRRISYYVRYGDNVTDSTIDSFDVKERLVLGEWSHFVFQWDKNGLPSGNKKELYLNGTLLLSSNSDIFPSKPLTHFTLGAWNLDDHGKAVTQFEQLAIHPSKGFSPKEIQSWYEAQAPFYDVRDTILFYQYIKER